MAPLLWVEWPRQQFDFEKLLLNSLFKCIGVTGIFWPKLAMAGRLIEQWPDFFVQFAQTHDKEMLKVLRRYLD